MVDPSSEELVAELARAFTTAVLEGDEIAADLVIRDAITAEISSEAVSEQIIAPALWLVGDLWQRGEISVADEHLATEISMRVLALEHETRRVERRRAGFSVLLATPAGEHHVVALRMFGGLLRTAGYDVVMLGPDVPAPSLAALASRHRVDVVGLSVTMEGSTDRALLALYETQELHPAIGFVIGGRALTSRVPQRPGIEICRKITDGVRAVDAIVHRAGLN